MDVISFALQKSHENFPIYTLLWSSKASIHPCRFAKRLVSQII